MNHMSASLECVWQVPRYNQRSSPSRLSHLEEPTQLNGGGISGDLTRLFSTNGALCAVKGTEECDEAHDDLTR